MDEATLTAAAATLTGETKPAEGVNSAVAPEATPAVKPNEGTQFASRFAALAKKEAAIRAEADAIKAQRAEYDSYVKAKQTASNDPIAALQALGLTYKQVTDFLLNDSKPPVDSAVAALEAKLEAFQKAQEDKAAQAAAAQEQQVYAQFKAGIDTFIQSNAETYELIASNNASQLVYDTIEEAWKLTGKLLSNKDAADQVESYLEEQAKKILQLKKFQPKEQSPGSARPQANQPQTISAHTHVASSSPTPRRYRSTDEAIAEAAKLLMR